jgi:dolichol kinase
MNKSNVEIKRKSLHLLFGILVVLLLFFGFIDKIHIFFSIMISIIISFLYKKYDIPIIHMFMQNVERRKDLAKFPGKGLIFYLIGIFLVLSFFPLDIAMPSILILAFADSAGHLFGMHFGRIRHPFVSTKFVEGFVVGLIAGFLGALVFAPWHEALAASFFAMLAEGIEIKIGAEEVDDNILIPLVAAIAISAVRYLV